MTNPGSDDSALPRDLDRQLPGSTEGPALELGAKPAMPEDGQGVRAVTAGGNAYVAGRDQFVIHVNVPQDQSSVSDALGPGRRLFTASLHRHSGQLSIAFGAGNTLVVTEKDTTVHRWSLGDHAPLPGASASPAPRLTIKRMDIGTRMAASTVRPTVAVSRGAQITILHFGDAGYRAVTVPLDTDEFLVAADGERFATFDGGGVSVRDFADGSVIWRVPGPRHLATATVDSTGTTVAMACGPNAIAGSNKVVVASQDDPRPYDFQFANFPIGAGCHLAFSPDGELVACASFREIVVARPRTGEIVHRRPLASEDLRAAFGTRPHRLICSTQGDLLWFRGRRVVDVHWPAERPRYLSQEGLCDDIAFDHAGSRLAMVSESGQVKVFPWNSRT